MPGFEGAAGGAATGALIGSVIPGVGTAIGAGIGGLFGYFGGRRKRGRSEGLMLDRFNQMQDPNYMRSQFLDVARDLAPSQSDIMGRLRAGGLGHGVSSILANQQFNAEQNRTRAASSRAYSQFQLGNQSNINSLLGGIAGQENYRKSEESSFNNELLSGGLGLLGMGIGGGQFGGGY